MAKLAEVALKAFRHVVAENIPDGHLTQDMVALKTKSNTVHLVSYSQGSRGNKTNRITGCKGGRISKDIMRVTCKACIEWIADWTVQRQAELESLDKLAK